MIVAVELFTEPHELVTRTQKFVVAPSGPTFNVLDVAPLTGELVSPVLPRNHWNASVPLPVACTESVRCAPGRMLELTG